jgi:protein SCO1/2
LAEDDVTRVERRPTVGFSGRIAASARKGDLHPMLRRYAPWILVGLAALALAAIVAWRYGAPAAPSQGVSLGGDFHLVDQSGRPVDQGLLKHKWTAMFFGYTFCPDVCPTTLQTLGAASRELGGRAKDFQVVFITVDPERDTPNELKAYLSSAAFPAGTIGLTGSPGQIAQVAKAYGVYYQREGSGPGYAVDHSSAIYLTDPEGRFDSVIAFGLTPDQTRDQILKAMRQKGAAA